MSSLTLRAPVTFWDGGPALPAARIPADLGAGATEVLLRPEFVDVHAEDGAGRLRVELANSSFLGESVRADLRLPGTGVHLVAKVTGARAHTLFSSSQPNDFYVSWDPGRIVTLAQ